jgi:chromosome segregation protein
MYLKRLEIVGFKSFTERTSVDFSRGISAVVGPNGCGKSNIIDAIRWVMGEQSPRLLRARNMEDLLFNGSIGRSPASVAEVTLTLARDDEQQKGQAEVSVTRRLYRGGDSEYLINRIPCRLKDLVRFFIEAGMGTRAYNIIEQEKVGRLVDSPPEERRLLIDEAAGITRFKEQKKESERRLESASQNLSTVALMLAETGKHLASVSRAAAKANRWQAIRAELRELELILSAKRFLEFNHSRNDLVSSINTKKNELALVEAKNTQIELEVDTLRLSDTSHNQTLETELNQFHQTKSELDKLDLEIYHMTADREAAGESRDAALVEFDGLDEDYERHLEDYRRLEEIISNLEVEHAKAKETRHELKEKWKVLEAESQTLLQIKNMASKSLEEASEDLRRLGETLAGTESLAEHLKGRHLELELESNQADQTINEAKERLASRQRFKATIEEDLAAARERAKNSLRERDQAKAVVEAEVRNLGQAERIQAGLSSRLDTLEALKDSGFGWYPDGAVALLRDPEARGLIGPVAESLTVPDGYEEATEAALGDKLGWILVKDRKAGLEALKLAREKGLGRCGFISEEALGSKGLSETLLGRIELRPSVSEDMLESKSSFLTLDGDYLGTTLMAGGQGGGTEEKSQGNDRTGNQGSRSENQKSDKSKATGETTSAKGGGGLLARIKELEFVRAQLLAAEEETARINQAVTEKRQVLVEAEEALSTASNHQAALNEDLNTATSKIMVADSEVKGLAIRRDSLSSEMARNVAEMAACEKKRAQAALEREDLQVKIEQLEEAFREASTRAEIHNGELEENRAQSQLAANKYDSLPERLESSNRELTRVNNWLTDLESRRESLETQAENLLKKQEDLSEKIEELTEKAANLPEELLAKEEFLNQLRRRIEENRVQLLEKEEQAKQSRKDREQIAQDLSELERQLLENDFSLKKINDDLLKDWRVVLTDPMAIPLDAGPPPEADTAASSSASDLGEDEATAPDDQGQSDDQSDSQNGNQSDDNGDDSETEDENEQINGETPSSLEEMDTPQGQPDQVGETSVPLDDSSGPEEIDANFMASIELPEMAEASILNLRDKLASLGEVNLEAIKEEAELSKNHEFHKTQHDDLTKAISDLHNSILRINQTCRERFNQTFEQASQKFREIFPILFEGGDGWLSLSNESDPLESGVEIHVHPPGKKIMVMRSLSGGEKTLTSLCLIFALYLIKPSPFCLLDEADAPLDEANIDRFNKLLRNLSQASQIIMVTHNKRTMQISNTLYGVTMETPGVSKLVSVNLADAEVLTDA